MSSAPAGFGVAAAAAAAAVNAGSSADNIKESWNQIKLVQGMIERCLQQHMTQVSAPRNDVSYELWLHGWPETNGMILE